MLVITPNLTIRKGVSDALDIASRECFWTKTRVLVGLHAGSRTPPFSTARRQHPRLHREPLRRDQHPAARQLGRPWLPQFPPNFFDMILVDEGHHAAAESWQKVFRRFPNAKVVSLTATPFRADQQPLQGEVIYRYPFARAMMNGFIKQIHSRNVAPVGALLHLPATTPAATRSTRSWQLREEQWFRRGVALSPECNRHIAEASIQRCDALRAQTGIQHQIIAAACSVDHARQVRAIYEECGYRAAEIHSDMDEDEQEAVLDRLQIGQLDCIVQVQMLGEGFDHPRLSVAAVFRPFRSLAPYIQFVGRVMRVVIQDQPEHPDNQGFVVSHVGLNNDARWEEFRELDLEDQALVHGWARRRAPADNERSNCGTVSRAASTSACSSTTSSSADFVDQAFLDPDRRPDPRRDPRPRGRARCQAGRPHRPRAAPRASPGAAGRCHASGTAADPGITAA